MNHEEWLKARLNGIGGSDAACILGLNPWKSNVELWEEKTGRRIAEDIGDKPVVQYGKKSEEYLRELFRLDFPQYQVTYDEFGMIHNYEYPFIFATLDGTLTDERRKGVLEIKTTEIMRGGQYAEWKDKIPDHYFCQCLHELLATGYEFLILKAQIKFNFDGLRLETKHYTIERDDVLNDLDYLLKEEIKFWECVQKDKRPALILPEI